MSRDGLLLIYWMDYHLQLISPYSSSSIMVGIIVLIFYVLLIYWNYLVKMWKYVHCINLKFQFVGVSYSMPCYPPQWKLLWHDLLESNLCKALTSVRQKCNGLKSASWSLIGRESPLHLLIGWACEPAALLWQSLPVTCLTEMQKKEWEEIWNLKRPIIGFKAVDFCATTVVSLKSSSKWKENVSLQIKLSK